jgi:predicted metal-dependent enzyme (double-stranded beta helix superfamily)
MFAVPPNTVALPARRAATHPVGIAREFAADRSRWSHRLRYQHDQRWSGLLEMTDDHEVWLLSWLPGQRTALHDHGGATGAFTVVFGALTERVVGTAEGSSTVEVLHPLAAGQSRAFGPNYVHHVSNEGPDPAVSIHVYRPSRAAMTRYRLDPARGLVRL